MQIVTCVTCLAVMGGLTTALTPKKPPLPPPIEYYRTVGQKPPPAITASMKAASQPTRASSLTVASQPVETKSADGLYKAMKCDLTPISYDAKDEYGRDYGPDPADRITRPRYVHYSLWCPPADRLNLTLDVKDGVFVGKDLAKSWGGAVISAFGKEDIATSTRPAHRHGRY